MKRHHDNLKKGDPKPHLCYTLLGVYVDESVTQGKRKFDLMIREVKPDVVIYMTTAQLTVTWSYDGKVTAPNIWEGSQYSIVFQPTFKDVLEFRKQVTVPWGTRELLTFGVYAYENGPEQNQTFSETDSLGSPCLYNAINYREKVCPPSPDLKVWKDAPSQTVITLNKQSNKLYTFDDKDTLKQKMCWAAVNYNFNGGWAMLFVETSDTGNKCSDTKYGSDFALVQWMKQYMNITFNAC